MQSRIRARFIRSVVESRQVDGGATPFTVLRARLPPRLASLIDTELIQGRDPQASLPLDDGEALLFEIDSTLGDGSGRTLEDAGRSHATRMLTDGGLPRSAEPIVAARLLRGHVEQAFEEANVVFDVEPVSDGFTLTLGVGGRSRSTRALRHFAVGYLKALSTNARASTPSFRIYSEIVGDRARITVSMGQGEELLAQEPTSGPVTRRRPPSLPRPAGTLSEEVHRILGNSPTSPQMRRPESGSMTVEITPATGEDRESHEQATSVTLPAQPSPVARGRGR